MKKKRNLYIIAFLCFITLVGVTIAYLGSTSVLENIFEAGTYKTITHEEFTSPSNWLPGDETPKTITTKNEGTIPVMVRVKFDEEWTSKNDDDLPLTYNDENVAIINFDNETDWIYRNGYYYYTSELAPGETTSSLIKSVTFNPNVNSDVSCTTVSGTVTCESTGDGYDGATYKLRITTETVQSKDYETIWEDVPIMYDYVGDNPCTYNGELEVGTEYINGQYTYRYRQEWDSTKWIDISNDGWGVVLTDLESTAPVTTTLCSSINNKPIVSMNAMFYNSQSTSLDLSSFDTSNVANMRVMFGYSQAGALDLLSFDTSNVTNMSSMFYGSEATTIDVSSFDTSNVVSMNTMFSLTKITQIDLSDFDTSNVTSMKGMFQYCQIPILDLSSFDTSNVTSMYGMFMGANPDISLVEEIIGIEDFDVSNVTDMRAMFQRCVNLESLDLSNWDTSSLTTTHGMFNNCISLESLNISTWDTSNVVSMRAMFYGCIKLKTLDLSSFDTSSVTDMGTVFYECRALETIYVSNKWNTSLVTSSENMFYNCTNLPGYNSSMIDVSMANTNGGYLTLKST